MFPFFFWYIISAGIFHLNKAYLIVLTQIKDLRHYNVAQFIFSSPILITFRALGLSKGAAHPRRLVTYCKSSVLIIHCLACSPPDI